MDLIICCVIGRFAAEELETVTRASLFRQIKEKSFDTAFPLQKFYLGGQKLRQSRTVGVQKSLSVGMPTNMKIISCFKGIVF